MRQQKSILASAKHWRRDSEILKFPDCSVTRRGRYESKRSRMSPWRARSFRALKASIPKSIIENIRFPKSLRKVWGDWSVGRMNLFTRTRRALFDWLWNGFTCGKSKKVKMVKKKRSLNYLCILWRITLENSKAPEFQYIDRFQKLNRCPCFLRWLEREPTYRCC